MYRQRFYNAMLFLSFVSCSGASQSQELKTQSPNQPPASGGQLPEDEAMQLAPSPSMNAEKDGLNLFGDRVGDLDRLQPATSPDSTIKGRRILAEIKSSIELSEQYGLKSKAMAEQMRIGGELEKERTQWPNEVEFCLNQAVALQLEMVRLRPALRLPPDNPQHVAFFQRKAELAANNARRQSLQLRKTTLPVDMTNCRTTAQGLEQDLRDLSREQFEKDQSWSRLLSVFEQLSLQEAAMLTEKCQISLIEYPELPSIQVVQALAHIQNEQFQTAKLEFEKVLNKLPPGVNPSTNLLRFKSLIGLAWTEMSLGDLDQARRLLASAGELDASDYELTVCKGVLQQLSGNHRAAYEFLMRATNLDPKRQEAFRLVSELISSTLINSKDPGSKDISSKGIQLAKEAVMNAEKACKLDEINDYRNFLALAKANVAAKDFAAAEYALEKAESNSKPRAEKDITAVRDVIRAATPTSSK